MHSADSDCGMFQNLAMGITESTTSHSWLGSSSQAPAESAGGQHVFRGEMRTAWETGSKSAMIHISPGPLKGRQDSDELLNIKEAPKGV